MGKLTDENRLSLLFPKLCEEWDVEKNYPLTPNDVSFGSNLKVWWKCLEGHSWEATVNNRASGQHSCPICSKSSISKQSQKWLDDMGIFMREYRVGKKGDNSFIVDGFDPETNTIYEFLGDFWHGNPLVTRFPIDSINYKNRKTFGQLYTETIKKLESLAYAGYKVIYVWEKDFEEGKTISGILESK